MSMAMAGHRGPPTPPIRDHYKLRQGSLHGQPATNLPYAQDYFDDNLYMPSGSTSAYNSPRPGQGMIDEFGAPYTHVRQNEQGVWRQYDGYGGQTFLPYQDSVYSNPLQHHSYPNPAIHGRLPTPDASDPTGRTPRQARRLVPSAYERTPSPPKRRKGGKKDASKKSKLEKPLSELTRHLEHIPIKDTETWVNRSTEERQKEVGGDGFIKRPSNSFILYRSAYADRCREYEKSNNHQDISSMAGASWAIEAPEVRKQYEDWAKTERENHQAAFPDYKFQPQTQEAKARKRKGKMDDESLEESDPEDPTFHLGRGATPGSLRSTRMKKQRRNYRENSYTPSLGSDDGWGTPNHFGSSLQNPSYYRNTNPEKPLPAALSRMGPSGGYYQTTSHPNDRYLNMGRVEDVLYQQNDASGGIYGTAAPIGMPGGSHEDLMGESSMDNGQLMFAGPTLDPDLLAFDSAAAGSADANGGLPSGGFQASDYLAGDDGDFSAKIGQLENRKKWDPFEYE